MTFLLLFLAACFLAYSNSANDNFEGVASLFGSRTCGYRMAISWAHDYNLVILSVVARMFSVDRARFFQCVSRDSTDDDCDGDGRA